MTFLFSSCLWPINHQMRLLPRIILQISITTIANIFHLKKELKGPAQELACKAIGEDRGKEKEIAPSKKIYGLD